VLHRVNATEIGFVGRIHPSLDGGVGSFSRIIGKHAWSADARESDPAR
jgi:hypothetical protein